MKLAIPSLASMATAIVLSGSVIAAENRPNVVASIKPVHSLVANVMQGVGKPVLLVSGAGSPHTHALRPSQAAALERADIVFWVGHDLEAFLEKSIETISRRTVSVELIEASGLRILAVREGGAFASHDHDHEAEKEGARADAHDDGHKNNPDRRAVDAHIWLDPVNAQALTGAIKDALINIDPARRRIYEANAAALIKRLDGLIRDVTAALAPVKDRPFVVFHDGYQYFEKRFGIAAAGSITVSPEITPGAARLGEIRARLKTLGLGATCVFAEPQFEPKLVSVVIEGTSARAGVIDPLGAGLEPGRGLYVSLIRNMSRSIRDCLSKPG